MRLQRSLALSVWLIASTASADVIGPPPLEFYVSQIDSVPAQTRAIRGEVERAVRTVRATVEDRLPSIAACSRFDPHESPWRYRARHAFARITFTGAERPSEVSITSSTFPSAVGVCIRDALRTVELTPAIEERVVLNVRFERN